MTTHELKTGASSDIHIKRYFEDRIVTVPLTTVCFLVDTKLPDCTGWILADDFERSRNTGILLLEKVSKLPPEALSRLAIMVVQERLQALGRALPEQSKKLILNEFSDNVANDTGGDVQLAIEIGKKAEIKSFHGFLTMLLGRSKPNLTKEISFENLSPGSFHLINHFGDGKNKLSGTVQVSCIQEAELILTGRIIIQSESQKFQEIEFQETPIKVVRLEEYIQLKKEEEQKEKEEKKEVLRRIWKQMEEELSELIPPLPKMSETNLDPKSADILLIVPEDELDRKGRTVVTRKDTFGWLFDHLYLRRNGFTPRLCADTSDILELVTESIPDLVIWFVVWEMQEKALEFLLNLQKSQNPDECTFTFLLLTAGHKPYPRFEKLANAVEHFIIDPKDFLGVVLDLLNHRRVPFYKAIVPLQIFGGDMRNHTDPEIRDFFRKLPP